jgi:hypothetical protein
MRTKNIQQFRTSWRNQEGYNMSDWDENFIGSAHDGKLFGFYRMVNGIVDNIKADLSPKLQNAQDEQAIYEFLQNAADSQSTECAVIYDEQYFMVINNGKPFSDKDLKALLNSFQGTKSDKTKADNCGKIGRYGIGFKLAYRLMGKSDGAEELLKDLAGPLLFSWHNKKQFDELLNHKGKGNFNEENNIQGTDASWLLKIILACFPVGLGEKVKDLDYIDKELFNNDELNELLSFIAKHRDKIDRLSLKQGSLFFLKFGPKKHEKLKESLLNIQSGIGYSMNTLKTLEKVVLQDTVVEKFEIDTEKFHVQPGSEEFLRIDPEFPFCPIDITLGFPKDSEQLKALKRAPNVYQFFPMRNERHSMAYFIHATSFSKITDRTRLDDQGEANIESFKYISKALKKQLTKYRQDNFEQFSVIYRSLLMSDKSDEYDADLINNHLYNPLLEYIRSAIPTHKKNFYLKDLVVVKDTRLNIDPMSLGIGKEWFYWTDTDSDKELMNEAVNNAKLGLKRWGLKDLLMEGSAPLLDIWIENLSANEYEIFVNELKDVVFDTEFLEKFQFVKCFRFSDNKGQLEFFSIKDLQGQDNVFLMSERLMSVHEEIKALGFAVLEFNIQDYAEILKQLEKQLDYLSSDRSLYTKITERTVSSNLTAAQKYRLFEFLAGLSTVRTDELRKLPLFSNRYGQVMPLQSILDADASVEPWLEDFKISKNEHTELLKKFYCQSDSWEVFEYIISPFWDDLVMHSTLKEEEAVKQFYERVQYYFRLKPGMSKPLDAKLAYIDSKTGFLDSKSIFYYKSLSESTNYPALKNVFLKALGLHLPHLLTLEYLSADPCRMLPTTVSKEWKNTVNELLKACREVQFTATEKQTLFALLKTILSPADLQKVELFENNKGQKTAAAYLIAASVELEPWLKPFQIKKSEDTELLSGFLVSEFDIFNNIIVENWDSIITDNEVLKNIAAFYQSVEKYAQLSKNPKPITNLKYVFIDKESGFVDTNKLCYHAQMERFENYRDLRKAIKSVSDLLCPAAEVLPYLTVKPFRTKDSGIGRAVKSKTLLSREEVMALMHFMELIKEDFFKVLTVTDADNSREYLLEKRTKAVPYYLEKSQIKLADKILEAFGDNYKLLPQKLFQSELKNEGLLMGAALFNVLSKSKEVSPELLSAMIVESENAELQELVFGKIDKIILREDKIYGKDSFEHQALQIFRNKDADFSKIREKIIVEDTEGNQFKLTDIGFDSQLNFSIEREGKFSLNLPEILPDFTKYFTLLDKVLNNLVDYEAPTLLKKRCFEAQEMSYKRVLSELKNQGNELKNSAQLSFVLLLSKSEDNSRLSREFMVHNQLQEWVPLSLFDFFYIKQVPFIDPSAILDSKIYAGLSDLLKISDAKKYSFEFVSQRIILEPFIDKGQFYSAPLKLSTIEHETGSGLKELLDYAYKKWAEEDNLPISLSIISGSDELSESLEFSNYVFPDEYALLKEQLPAFVKTWLGKDAMRLSFDDNEDVNIVAENEDAISEIALSSDKLSFLIALGLNAHRSQLVRMRRYFHNKKGRVASQKQFNDIQNSGKQHLLNSILWMQSEATLFSSEDDRIHWLRKLYSNLDQLSNSTPLPFISKVKAAEPEIFVYQLDVNPEKNLFYFDTKQQQLLLDKYELTIAHVFNVMKQANIRMTNLSIKNHDIPSSTIEEQLDIDHLRAESKEWAAPHYLKWREESPYRINLYDGKIPYALKFMGQIIKILRIGNAVVQDKNAFVNSHAPNIEESLFEVSSRNTLSELMLLQLLRYKNETEAPSLKHPVIEKIFEKVIVQEIVSDDEEVLENPELKKLLELKDSKSGGLLKMTFDLNELSPELTEELMKLSKSTRIVVTKDKQKK